jgi:hypothetical protein
MNHARRTFAGASFLLLALLPAAAWATQSNLTNDSGFGARQGAVTSETFTSGDDPYTIQEATFLNNGVYPYEYAGTVNAGSGTFSQVTLGTNGYRQVLNVGNSSGTSFLGVTPTLGASFNFNVATTSLNPGDNLNSQQKSVVYLHSTIAPSTIGLNVLDGTQGDAGTTPGPAPAEPASMAVLGCGIALMGGFLRRRKS